MYDNHYNEKFDKCFMLMADTKDVAGKLHHFRQLLDAFEGRDLGYFFRQIPDPDTVIECRVTLPSGEDKHCHTVEEFEELVKVYIQ